MLLSPSMKTEDFDIRRYATAVRSPLTNALLQFPSAAGLCPPSPSPAPSVNPSPAASAWTRGATISSMAIECPKR